MYVCSITFALHEYGSKYAHPRWNASGVKVYELAHESWGGLILYMLSKTQSPSRAMRCLLITLMETVELNNGSGVCGLAYPKSKASDTLETSPVSRNPWMTVIS
jgi:hypothetical protein